MSVRFFSRSSIKTGVKSADFWDGSAVILYNDFFYIGSGTGTGNTITVSSIPSTYKNLRIYYTGRTDAGSTSVDNCQIRLNGGGSNDYYGAYWGSGNATTTSVFPMRTTASSATSDYLGAGWMDIFNYSATSGPLKQIHGYYTAVSPQGQEIFTGYHTWTVSNTAINSITFGYGAGNFVAGSKIDIYGYN
jgi:hypothetical protein